VETLDLRLASLDAGDAANSACGSQKVGISTDRRTPRNSLEKADIAKGPSGAKTGRFWATNGYLRKREGFWSRVENQASACVSFLQAHNGKLKPKLP